MAVNLIAVCTATLLVLGTIARAQLTVDFYNTTCPNLSNIVLRAMRIAKQSDPVNMPGVLRLFAHDAFVNGCDGSVLLDSIPGVPSEKESEPNLTLFGFDAVALAKSLVESQCPGIVSCADILALSAQFAVQLTSGPLYSTPLGRRDSTVSLKSDADAQIPVQTMTISQLTANFAAQGLDQHDLVTLSGAHTIGFAHCNSFSDRLYNFNNTGAPDPTLDPTFADQLQPICPQTGATNSTVQELDPASITKFDKAYYNNLKIQEGLLQSDQELFQSSLTRKQVNSYASNQAFFFGNFTLAMIKLGSQRVLSGTQGQIRAVCNVVNS